MTAEVRTLHTPASFLEALSGLPGLVCIRAGGLDALGRFTVIATRPLLVFRSLGDKCELCSGQTTRTIFGNPWEILGTLLSSFRGKVSEPGLQFPMGGFIGFWGYELRRFIEPRLGASRGQGLPEPVPDCEVGLYTSLVVFDEVTGRTYVAASGLNANADYTPEAERLQVEGWRRLLEREPNAQAPATREQEPRMENASVCGNTSREQFLRMVEAAQNYIRQGDVYQVNVSHRLATNLALEARELFLRLWQFSPAPCSAFYDGGSYQLACASPELFLRLSGRRVFTRPIKGTRPTSNDSREDARLARELQASAKERAELVMITDLMRNDLGRVCQYGSISVSDLLRLERFSHVQHLVSTVEGTLRDELDHLQAFAGTFPGGSVTGAPKVRAMEIIDSLELAARGPYTGAIGFMGFNGQSQLNMLIRTAVCSAGRAWFNVGAGIVADSDPEAEWAETLAKARGFLQVLGTS